MRRVLISAVASIVVFGLAGVASAADKITIMLPVLGLESLPLMVAQDKGYFADHKVDVDIVAARGGGEAMKAFISGDATVTATGFPEFGLLRGRGVDAQLLVSQAKSAPFGIVARKDLGIKTFADLKGKNIGVSSPGSLTEYMANYFAMQQGWDPKRDIGVISLGGGAELLGALVSKKIDAAVLFEPFVSTGLQEGAISMVVDVPKVLDAFPTGPLVVQGSFLAKSPDQAKGLHDAVVAAERFIQEDKAGAFDLAKKRFPNTKPEVLTAAFERMYPVYSPDGKFSKESLDRTQEICVKLGVLKETYPYDKIVAAIDR